MSKRILIIEDEQDISRILKDYLAKHGFRADIAGTGEEGIRLLTSLQPDYVILDLMLPDVDGIELCRRIRETSRVPILILSARGSDTDKVLGLGFGADDYMTKPFSLGELTARIQAFFRRHDGIGAAVPSDDPDIIRAGPLTVNRKAYQTLLNGKEIPLSAKEFELLFFLASHPNQVFAKSRLLDAVWGYEHYGDDNTVTVYVKRLREKLEPDPSTPVFIKTVWGVGYKFAGKAE